MGNGTDGSSTENGAASSVVKADGSLKKKKKEIKSNGEVVSENVVQKATSAEVSKDIPLENKKKRKLSESNEDSNNVTSAAVDESNSDSTKDMKKVSNSEVNGDLPNTDENVKQKKKKKKREMYRVDSDICFGNPSLSATNLVALNSEETPKKEESRLPSIQETAAEPTPEGSPELKPSGPLKKKKKMGRQTAGSSLKLAPEGDNDSKGVAESSVSKTFEEVNDWDSPLKPGETEILLPSKSYKGSVKLKEAVSEEPTIAPVQSFTAKFLKKSLSKSKTPKSEKASLSEILSMKSVSEPKKKKINFALTQNLSIEDDDYVKSVKNSPQIPHDPEKNPKKTLLKKRVSLESGKDLQISRQALKFNTQQNSKSKAAKKLAKGTFRSKALDFF